jgi:photosystem II stability/assembly factor-like uncharacterized protein
MLKMFYILFLSILISIPAFSKEDKKDDKEKDKEKFKSATFNGMKLRLMGPAMTSGRIIDLAVHPKCKSTFYVAVACGNVWKTTNSGLNFTPIFDNYGSYSIGCVTIDPSNPHTVWVGTGENNSQRSVGYGDGIYKSNDDGKSFKKMGLEKSEHIAKIIVDPNNSDIVYVAAQGPLWADGGDRGLYKTTDGGKTWVQSLKISEMTGVTDIVMDPRDPKTLYCASYQRRRHVWTLINGGPEATVYKSTNAGESWDKINNGLPAGDLGRIGLAISPQNPDVLYAIIEAPEKGGFFKTTDRGASWNKQSDYYSGSAQYYHEIFCDPVQFDLIYVVETYTQVSKDGGKTWSRYGLKERHVDDHALWIDKDNNKHMMIGGDGGLYESFDQGSTFRFFENLPVTQFYRIQADNTEPFYYVYGGTQDNNSIGGPSRTTDGNGIFNQDWFYVVGGDGYEPQIDPSDPNIVYGQWQYGNLVRFDKKSGEITGIQPQPEKDEELRWNWDTPVIISPHSPTRLYIAANKVYRSDDRGNTWKKISGDISRQINRDELPVMSKIWGPEAVAKNASTSLFGNAICLTESPKQENLLYVGTDDGLIQVTENNGSSWTKIDKFAGVPETTYVSDIYPSRHDANVVYASFNNHKNADFKPYILKSNDKGKSWTSISGDLPENGAVWTIEEDPVNPNLLFVGTEFGVYFTNDGGKKWLQLKGGFPTIAVRDLDIQERENDLVIGTFGRGIYILDDYSPLRNANKELLDKEANIFPIKDALMFTDNSSKTRRCEGETFYRAENPPFGAIFTYYLKETPKSKKDIRLEKEKELRDAGKTPPYPSFAELKVEDEEEASYLMFIIKDSKGNIVRKLQASPSEGINRLAWDLRYTYHSPLNAKTKINEWSGVPIIPGKYNVTLTMIQDGKSRDLAGPVEFNCKPLNNVTLPAPDRVAMIEFQNKIFDLNSAVEATNKSIQNLNERLELIKITLKSSENAKLELIDITLKIDKKLKDFNLKLNGDASISKRNANQPMSINERIGYIVGTMWSSTSVPTQTNIDGYKIAGDGLSDILNELKSLYNSDFKLLEQELDKINAPWTPGRFPEWKK